MSNGLTRFSHYLDKVETSLQQAAREKNPALWLYSNDLRTPMFMLQALCRLYGSMHNKAKFDKLREHFKLLEDGMGAIDYYDNYAKAFSDNPGIPAHIREYMEAQTREKIQHVNDLLENKKWLGENASRLKKIRKTLKAIDWMNSRSEVKAVQSFYKDEIKEAKSLWTNTGGRFTDMEDHLHEFRRDIRWLSIYPQALQGMIQLAATQPTGENIHKYLVDDVVHSKYNVMPQRGDNQWLLLLEKNYFYALSWMISETGKLKDEGLQFFAVAEALQQTERLSHEDALTKSYQLLNTNGDPIAPILQKASVITESFMTEKNLDKLICGVEKIRSRKSKKKLRKS